jgi:hypothetical protein
MGAVFSKSAAASWSAVAEMQGHLASATPLSSAGENEPKDEADCPAGDSGVALSLANRIDSLRSPFGQHFVLSISAPLRFHDAGASHPALPSLRCLMDQQVGLLPPTQAALLQTSCAAG